MRWLTTQERQDNDEFFAKQFGMKSRKQRRKIAFTDEALDLVQQLYFLISELRMSENKKVKNKRTR